MTEVFSSLFDFPPVLLALQMSTPSIPSTIGNGALSPAMLFDSRLFYYLHFAILPPCCFIVVFLYIWWRIVCESVWWHLVILVGRLSGRPNQYCYHPASSPRSSLEFFPFWYTTSVDS